MESIYPVPAALRVAVVSLVAILCIATTCCADTVQRVLTLSAPAPTNTTPTQNQFFRLGSIQALGSCSLTRIEFENAKGIATYFPAPGAPAIKGYFAVALNRTIENRTCNSESKAEYLVVLGADKPYTGEVVYKFIDLMQFKPYGSCSFPTQRFPPETIRLYVDDTCTPSSEKPVLTFTQPTPGLTTVTSDVLPLAGSITSRDPVSWVCVSANAGKVCDNFIPTRDPNRSDLYTFNAFVRLLPGENEIAVAVGSACNSAFTTGPTIVYRVGTTPTPTPTSTPSPTPDRKSVV